MRRRGKDQIGALNGVTYSGSLLVGETTHLITDSAALATLLSSAAPSDKLRLAIDAGIPILSHQWLEDSARAGRVLPTSSYEINIDAARQAMTEASWTTGNAMSPVEKLREAPAMTSQQNLGFIDEPFSPGPDPSSHRRLTAITAEPLSGPSTTPRRQVLEAEELSLGELSSPDSLMRSYCSLRALSDLMGASPGGRDRDRSPGLPPIPEDIEFNPLFELEERPPGTISDGSAAAAALHSLTISHHTTRVRTERSSLLRFAPLGAPHLPHSIVTPGPPAAKKPSAMTLAGIKSHHNTPRAPLFFSSAKVLIGLHRKQEVVFRAGDIAHGAKIIYDVDQNTGQQIFAHVIIKSIYALAGKPEEIWMEHHYLFNCDDMEERSAWRAALEANPMEDDELLLSANAYHSPCDLIVGDFGVEMEQQDARSKKRQWRRKGGDGGAEVTTNTGKYFPVLSLGRAFNAAEVREVPLYTALADFS